MFSHEEQLRIPNGIRPGVRKESASSAEILHPSQMFRGNLSSAMNGSNAVQGSPTSSAVSIWMGACDVKCSGITRCELNTVGGSERAGNSGCTGEGHTVSCGFQIEPMKLRDEACLPSDSTITCPELAKEHSVITDVNLDSLYLSTYDRTKGTQVSISCLVSSFTLVGQSVLTCLGNAEWDKEPPRCYHKDFKLPLKSSLPSVRPSIKQTETDRQSYSTTDDIFPLDGSTTSYIVTVCVLAIMFLCLVLVLLYLIRLRKLIDRRLNEIDNRPPYVRAVDSLRSFPSTSSGAYEYYRRSHSPISMTSSNYSRHHIQTSMSSSDSSGYIRPPSWKARERCPIQYTHFSGR